MKKFLYPTLAIIVSLLILFVSIARATLEIAAQENSEDRLRINPIEFVINNDDGTTETSTYKLPEVNTLPSSPFYGFKKLRDFLWLTFSGSSINKTKVAILLADKKMAETRELFRASNPRLGLEASHEAIDKLKYAESQLVKTKEQATETNQLHEQIRISGAAFREIIKPLGETFDLDQEKYKQLVTDLENFNEEQQKEKAEMER